MKKQIIVIVIASLFAMNLSAQNKDCSQKFDLQSMKNSKSRGVDLNAVFYLPPSSPVKLPNELAPTRGKSNCNITIENKTTNDVNVYIDSVYVGYVIAGEKGKLNPPKGKYSTVHCWTTAGASKWYHTGSCPCTNTFVLVK